MLCLQEVTERLIEMVQTEIDYPYVYWVPMQVPETWEADPSWHRIGVAILSRLPITNPVAQEYGLFSEDEENRLPRKPPPCRCVLASCIIDGVCIATTHAFWTANGHFTLAQRVSLERLLLRLEHLSKPLILTGDFNAPRGRGGYELLANRYQDRVPSTLAGTLDPELHYTKQKKGAVPEIVVDGIFAAGIQVPEAKVHYGVSDHLGLSTTF